MLGCATPLPITSPSLVTAASRTEVSLPFLGACTPKLCHFEVCCSLLLSSRAAWHPAPCPSSVPGWVYQTQEAVGGIWTTSPTLHLSFPGALCFPPCQNLVGGRCHRTGDNRTNGHDKTRNLSSVECQFSYMYQAFTLCQLWKSWLHKSLGSLTCTCRS